LQMLTYVGMLPMQIALNDLCKVNSIGDKSMMENQYIFT
jgi:hypothetical protein